MSYTTLTQCVNDQAFIDRVTAAAMKETFANPQFGDTEFGEALRHSPGLAQAVFMWPLSIDNEEAYEYAITASNPNPGGDETVITDAAIGSGIQTHWPPDPT